MENLEIKQEKTSKNFTFFLLGFQLELIILFENIMHSMKITKIVIQVNFFQFSILFYVLYNKSLPLL